MDGRSDQPGLFRPVEARRTFEYVILQIEQAIIEGRLRVGDRLPPERDLAEMLQVSRSSIREGLRVLEAFGVVRARRGSGAQSGSVIADTGRNSLASLLSLYAILNRTPLRDLVEIRQSIEVGAVRLAAARSKIIDLTSLSETLAAMKLAEAPEHFLEVDTDFHLALAELSGNAIAPMFMSALREAMARQMLRAFNLLGNWRKERDALILEHVHITELVAVGDVEGSAELLGRHIRGFYSRVLEDFSGAEELSADPSRRSITRNGVTSIDISPQFDPDLL